MTRKHKLAARKIRRLRHFLQTTYLPRPKNVSR